MSQSEDKQLYDAGYYICLSGHSEERAYGIPEDKIANPAMRGVIVLPIKYYYGLDVWGAYGIASLPGTDGVNVIAYEARRFLNECMQGHYKAVELLFLRDEDYTVCNPAGAYLRSHRSHFLSRELLHNLSRAVNHLTAKLKIEEQLYLQGEMPEGKKAIWDACGYDSEILAECWRLLSAINEIWDKKEYTVYQGPGFDFSEKIRAGQIECMQLFKEYNAYLQETIKKIHISPTSENAKRFEPPSLEAVSAISCNVVQSHYAWIQNQIRAISDMQPVSSAFN